MEYNAAHQYLGAPLRAMAPRPQSIASLPNFGRMILPSLSWCNEIAPETFILAADPNITCYDEEWYKFVYATSFLFLLYVFGIPFITWIVQQEK